MTTPTRLNIPKNIRTPDLMVLAQHALFDKDYERIKELTDWCLQHIPQRNVDHDDFDEDLSDYYPPYEDDRGLESCDSIWKF